MAPAAAKELKGIAAPGDGLTVLQPPVDRNEQVAAIRRLEAQTGIMAPAAAKEITGGARAEWGSTMSRGKGWNREAFEYVVVPKRFQNVGNDTKERPSVRDLRSALSKSGGLPSNKTRINNKVTSKTIWIFWAQGEAHLAAQKQGKYGNCLVTCVQKWRDLNPNWTVELIDDARAKELSVSYARFINKGAIGQALLSDVLRLDLLNRYGGVWADVSVCPVSPLDDFIEEKLAPAGFYSLWLNHWPTADDALTCETQCYDEDAAQCNARVTVTWFMGASAPKNYIVHAWHREFTFSDVTRIRVGLWLNIVLIAISNIGEDKSFADDSSLLQRMHRIMKNHPAAPMKRLCKLRASMEFFVPPNVHPLDPARPMFPLA
jgi:hypothetical protein